MTYHSSDETERIFQLAVDLSPESRVAFLDAHCAAGTETRREIEELLRHFDEANDETFLSPLLTPPPGDERTSPSTHVRIGAYDVIDELGRGGMGIVYLVRDPRLDRNVAVKVIAENVAADPTWRARFQHEAQLLAAINHPNIATVHAFERREDRELIVMEFVEGGTLAARLERGRPTLLETISIVHQIALALEAAHERGIVHRDLKPFNVMFTHDDRAKVLDFGLAASLHGTGATSSDRGAGTPGYMSPEQAQGEAVDHRADIWAFGCVLYECLTGRAAFPGATAAERLAASLSNDPDWSAIPSTTPHRVVDITRRCLVRDPGGRLSLIQRARRDLDEELTLAHRRGAKDALPPSSTAHNLPLSLTSFVGRERDLDRLSDTLAENRLCTLTGAGGCGKSRLALEVSRCLLREFPDGVWLVDLAPLTDADRIAHRVLETLGVSEGADQSPIEMLAHFLEPRRALVILDNCERVVVETAHLANELLSRAPRFSVLATSREILGAPGEVTYRVSSLTVPEETDATNAAAIADIESVRLFCDRTRLVNVDFQITDGNAASIAHICRRLDGIPLAIELAAARAGVISVAEVAHALDDRFRRLTLSTRSRLSRHRTLRALIDWSYDELAPEEQAVLRRLAVFVGGFDLDALEAVAAAGDVESWEALDLVTQLVDKSLVEMEPQSASGVESARYRVLSTVRDHAAEHLERENETEEVRNRHRGFFIALADEAQAPILGGATQSVWLGRLRPDLENLRAALAACVDARDAEGALRIAAPVGRYLELRGRWTDGRDLCELALGVPGALDARTPVLARALHRAASLAQHVNDNARAWELYPQAVEVWKAAGDEGGLAGTLNNLGLLAMREGSFADADDYYRQALAINERIGNRAWATSNLINLGIVAQERGALDEAEGRFHTAVRMARELSDTIMTASALDNLAILFRYRGNSDRAREHHEESLEIYRSVSHEWGVATSILNLATLAHQRGDIEAARRMLAESLRAKQRIGDRRGVVHALEAVADLAVTTGDPGPGARLLGAAMAMREALKLPINPSDTDSHRGLAARLEDLLGDAGYSAQRAEGESLSPEDAIALGLSLL